MIMSGKWHVEIKETMCITGSWKNLQDISVVSWLSLHEKLGRLEGMVSKPTIPLHLAKGKGTVLTRGEEDSQRERSREEKIIDMERTTKPMAKFCFPSCLTSYLEMCFLSCPINSSPGRQHDLHPCPPARFQTRTFDGKVQTFQKGFVYLFPQKLKESWC